MLAPIVEKVVNEHPEVKLLRIDVDKNEELSARYNIVSIPTLIYFKDGKVANGNVGYIPEDKVLALIEIN